MAYPRKLLSANEEIVLEAHPNWSILAPRFALFLGVVAGSIVLLVLVPQLPAWVGWVLLGAAGLSIIWLLMKLVTWRSTLLVITNQRVVYRVGVLRRVGREIPLDRVQDVTYSQSLFERMIGAGNLTIESAGAGGEEPFPDIRHPAVVQSLINRLISQSSGSGGGLGSARTGYAPQAQPPPALYPQPGPQYPQPGPQYPQPQPGPQYPQPGPQYPQPGPQYPQPGPQYPQPQPGPQYPQQPPQAQTAPRYQPGQYQPPQYQPPGYDPAGYQSVPSAYPQPEPQPSAPYQAPPQPGQPYQSSTPSTGARSDVPEQLAQSQTEQLAHLERLRGLGVITEAEYESKRQEVLGTL